MIATAKEATGLTCEQLSSADYHADPAIGSSMLEDFRESRRLYEGRYILKNIPPRTVSDAMELGTWIHARLLEPDRYFATLADPLPDVAPDGKKWLKRKGSDHEKWWADELAKREGKIAISEFTRERIEAIAASVLAKKWAHSLLRCKGQPEYSIFWTDLETGLNLKCRVDWFSVRNIDLKTTGDPSPGEFVRTIVRFGYSRKLAHYTAGLAAITGAKEPLLLHIAVGTEPPYSAGAYEIDDRNYFDARTPRLGYQQWRTTLRELAECYATGDWSDHFENEVLELKLPGYAFTEDQWR